MIRIAVCDDENVIVNQIEHIISEVCKRESIPVNIDVFTVVGNSKGRLHQEQSMTSSFGYSDEGWRWHHCG